MASKVEIVNLGLIHIGVSKNISNLETEASQEAVTARLVYEPALKMVLRAYPWPFAKKEVHLALISEDTADDATWKYIYQYPSDCIKLHRLMPDPSLYTDPFLVRLGYELRGASTGITIVTNEEDAKVSYTQYVDSPVFYPDDFVMALSYYIGFLMAPKLTAGDPYELGKTALAMFTATIGQAQLDSHQEIQPETINPDRVSEYGQARDD